MTGEYALFKAIVEKIWVKYDVDNSGTLTREETKKFMIEQVFEKLPQYKNKGSFDDSAFEELYTTHAGEDGEITRKEMAVFI